MVSRDLVPIPNNARGWLPSASHYQLRSEKTEPLAIADVDKSVAPNQSPKMIGGEGRSRLPSKRFQNHSNRSGELANEMENRCGETRSHQEKGGAKIMLVNGEVILENVRRYRATASLYRQTAAFRPFQRRSLLDQADEWEQRAVAELETYFMGGTVDYQPQVAPYTYAPWETVAAA